MHTTNPNFNRASTHYRPEIDGLRAIAVIGVILFHAGFKLFSAGFLGVDVFFVITGFLITRILISEKREGCLSITKFYERRMRRILPALYFVLAGSTIISILIMLPSQLKEFGQSLVASVWFLSNFYFWIKANYWAQSSDLIPLLHLWSLGIEEQFYILFPLLIVFADEKNIKKIIIGLIFLSIGSMIYMQYNREESAAFFLLPFRAWELASGSLAAIIYDSKLQAKNLKTSGTSLILLLSSFIMFDKNTNPIILYSIPVISTIGILIGNDNLSISKILKNSYLVYIGTISYGLYLYHQPIFSFYRILNLGELSFYQICMCLLLIALLSTFSYRYIETPFRNKSSINNKSLLLFTCIFTAFFSIVGIYLHSSQGLKTYKTSYEQEGNKNLYSLLEQARYDREKIWASTDNLSSSPFEENEKIKILFVGDSVAQDLFVTSTLNKDLTNKAQLRVIGFDDECIKIYAQKFNWFSSKASCRNDIDAFKKSQLLANSTAIIISEAWLNNAKYLEDFIKMPEVKGKKIYVHATHSFPDISSLLIYLNRTNLNPQSQEFKKFVFSSMKYETLESNSKLANISRNYNLKTINTFDFFCDHIKNQCDILDQEGRPMLIDHIHLSTQGAIKLSPWLKNKILKALIEDGLINEGYSE